MSFSSLFRLTAANAGIHAADQIVLAALPIAATTLFAATPAEIGTLVAAQGAAWLVGSLPAGIMVDRKGPSLVARLAPLLSIAGLAAALLALMLGSKPLLAAAIFAASAGTVIYVLAVTTLIPRLTPAGKLAPTNARLELARALVTLPAPALVAAICAHLSPRIAFGLALAAACVALLSIASLPCPDSGAPKPKRHIARELAEGLRFTCNEPVLRAILACALAWNMAFFALISIFVPFALKEVHMSLTDVGLSLSGQGTGLLLGALAAGALVSRLEPRLVLIFGPLSSVLGILFIAAASAGPALPLAFMGFFLIGFGPLLWLVCQMSLRQAVTPPPLLGRVNAMIQLAIYGVRPLGALLGGFCAENWGYMAAIDLVAALFIVSTGIAVFSTLGRLRLLPVAG